MITGVPAANDSAIDMPKFSLWDAETNNAARDNRFHFSGLPPPAQVDRFIKLLTCNLLTELTPSIRSSPVRR